MPQIILKIGGLVAGGLSVATLSIFYFFPNYYTFFGIIFLWWMATILIGNKLSIGIDNIALHLSAYSAFFVLLSILEWLPAEILLIILSVAVFTILWWWPTIGQKNPAHFMQKPWRRIIMIIWVFCVYAWISGLSALLMFYQNIPAIVLSVIEGLLAAFAAFMILRLYNPGKGIKDLGLAIGAVAIIICELSFVVSFLPFGYLANGLIIVWIWYVIQLLIRFHVSPEGIIWRKQMWFLARNAILFVLMLYFVQWI